MVYYVKKEYLHVVMRKLVNIRPFVLVAFALVVVVASYYFSLSYGFFVVIACHLSVLFICAVLLFKNFSVYNLIFAIFSLVIIAVVSIRCLYLVNAYLTYQNYFNNDALIYGTVESVSATQYPDSFITVLKDVTVNGQKLDFSVSGFLDTECLKGQRIAFECNLSSCDGVIKYNLANSVVLEYSSVENFRMISDKTDIFTKISNSIKTVLKANSPENYDFAVALLLGDTKYISDELLTNFRYSGIAHIFAVSGLHIGFLCSIIGFLCELLYIKHFKKCVVVTLFAFIYAGICGFSVSSQRAVIMCFWLLACKSFGKYYDNLNAIALSLITVVVINPMSVLTNGFILSYVCVLSVVLFRFTFLDMLAKLPLPLRETLAVALSVLVGVTPILCYMFDYLSCVSAILNIVFLPIVSALYILLFISVALAFLGAVLPLKIVEVGIGIIKQLFSVTDFSKFVVFVEITPLLLIVYYILALFASNFINVKNDKKYKIIFALFLSTLVIAL